MGAIGVPPNPSRAAVPVVQWPDAILDPAQFGLSEPIKAAYNVGGNYLVQGSDLHKSRRALADLEFAVCHDLFLTPTAQQCDVVLPTTTSLEREDVIIPAGGNYLLYARQAVPPLSETRNDYDIFCELAGRLGFLAEYSEGRDAAAWLAHLAEQSEVPDLDEFKRTGIYLAEDQLRVGLSDFVADPQSHPLPTPSGRVEISSAAYARTGFEAIPHCRILEATAEYPLRLVTPHPRFRVHSQYDNIPSFGRGETQALWIHPGDARQRGIEHGQLVVIRSPQGSARIAACVTEEIMPGVVSLTEGVWPRFDADGFELAGSPNVLTSTEPTLPSRATRTHSVLVEVTAAPPTGYSEARSRLPSNR
jgi:anaerobic dimethyl sulfoxide reductase subunit A